MRAGVQGGASAGVCECVAKTTRATNSLMTGIFAKLMPLARKGVLCLRCRTTSDRAWNAHRPSCSTRYVALWSLLESSRGPPSLLHNQQVSENTLNGIEHGAGQATSCTDKQKLGQ